MKILMILGSRNPDGKTAAMAEAFIGGSTSAGGQCEKVFLTDISIERCRQCDENGWGDCIKKGRCVIEDGFELLTKKISGADGIVFANPVYFSDLSESMKAFLDRLRRITRHDSAKQGINGKRALGICVAGGGGGGAPACARILEHTLELCGFDVVDMVPVRRQNMELKRDVLERTGAWFVKAVAG
jgi:multimeric flavodoxin WrbA